MPFLRKYGVATIIDGIPLITRGGVDYKVNPTLSAGDVQISKDGGAFANIATLPTVTPSGSTSIEISLANTEVQAKRIGIRFIDQTNPKEWEDQEIVVETYGNANAQILFDLDSTDVASQTTVNTINTKLGTPATTVSGDIAAIPTNPLLTNDARLNFLDASILAVKNVADNFLFDVNGFVKSIQQGDVGITQAGADKVWGSTAANLTTLLGNVSELLNRITLARAGYLDKLNITGQVASSTEVTAIQNNTRVRVIVPPVMERPDSGSMAYKLHLYVYDEMGNMEAPDSTPTLSAVNQSGLDRSTNLGVVTMEGVGHYSVVYTMDTNHLLEQLIFEWSVIENGTTRLHGAASQVVDTTAVDFTAADRTKLESVYNAGLTAQRVAYLDNLSAGAVALESTLTAIKGTGWTNETLKALSDALTVLSGSVANIPLDTFRTGDARLPLTAIASSAEVAKETTLSTGLTSILSDLATIKGYTDTVENLLAALQVDLGDPSADTTNIYAMLQAIKAKSDKLTFNISNEVLAQASATISNQDKVDIATQVNTTLTSSHGAGAWGPGSGSGVNTVTITVRDNATNALIPDVAVVILDTENNLRNTAKTDVNGNAVINLDAGSYVVKLQKTQVNFSPSYALTVTGSGAVTFKGDLLALPIPSAPGMCILIADLVTLGMQPKSGVKLTATLKHAPKAVGGLILDNTPWEAVTQPNGRATLEVPQGVIWIVEFAPLGMQIEADTTGQTSLNISSLL